MREDGVTLMIRDLEAGIGRSSGAGYDQRFFTHRIAVFRRVIGIVDIVDSDIVARGAPLPDGTSETTGDYRYHSHHDQRNEADAHINNARS